MIIEEGALRVAVLPDLAEAGSTSFDSAATVDIPVERSGTTGQRAVVEIHRRIGGLPQRALIGGYFEPSDDGRLAIALELTRFQAVAEGATCPGQFGRNLARGIPGEFAPGVLTGCLQQNLPAGLLRLDRGAFDPVDSSIAAFSFAARVLAEVVQAVGFDDVEPRVRALLARLGSQ